MSEGRRARPQPTPETQHFWDGTRAGELRLQRCNACRKVYFPPRPFCPQTPEALQLDMPVEVAFEKLDDEITLPLFRPARR